MRHSEYQRRRLALEAQLQAALDLIRAGHAAKLRALERVWLSSHEGEGAGDDEVGAAGAKPASETAQNASAWSETPGQPPRHGRRRGGTLSDLRDALPRLPEVFEKRDVLELLGYIPPRATLYRALETLREEEKIAITRYSDGGERTRYRKLPGS
jgi:hypothetical protein